MEKKESKPLWKSISRWCFDTLLFIKKYKSLNPCCFYDVKSSLLFGRFGQKKDDFGKNRSAEYRNFIRKVVYFLHSWRKSAQWLRSVKMFCEQNEAIERNGLYVWPTLQVQTCYNNQGVSSFCYRIFFLDFFLLFWTKIDFFWAKYLVLRWHTALKKTLKNELCYCGNGSESLCRTTVYRHFPKSH